MSILGPSIGEATGTEQSTVTPRSAETGEVAAQIHALIGRERVLPAAEWSIVCRRALDGIDLALQLAMQPIQKPRTRRRVLEETGNIVHTMREWLDEKGSIDQGSTREVLTFLQHEIHNARQTCSVDAAIPLEAFDTLAARIDYAMRTFEACIVEPKKTQLVIVDILSALTQARQVSLTRLQFGRSQRTLVEAYHRFVSLTALGRGPIDGWNAFDAYVENCLLAMQQFNAETGYMYPHYVIDRGRQFASDALMLHDELTVRCSFAGESKTRATLESMRSIRPTAITTGQIAAEISVNISKNAPHGWVKQVFEGRHGHRADMVQSRAELDALRAAFHGDIVRNPLNKKPAAVSSAVIAFEEAWARLMIFVEHQYALPAETPRHTTPLPPPPPAPPPLPHLPEPDTPEPPVPLETDTFVTDLPPVDSAAWSRIPQLAKNDLLRHNDVQDEATELAAKACGLEAEEVQRVLAGPCVTFRGRVKAANEQFLSGEHSVERIIQLLRSLGGAADTARIDSSDMQTVEHVPRQKLEAEAAKAFRMIVAKWRKEMLKRIGVRPISQRKANGNGHGNGNGSHAADAVPAPSTGNDATKHGAEQPATTEVVRESSEATSRPLAREHWAILYANRFGNALPKFAALAQERAADRAAMRAATDAVTTQIEGRFNQLAFPIQSPADVRQACDDAARLAEQSRTTGGIADAAFGDFIEQVLQGLGKLSENLLVFFGPKKDELRRHEARDAAVNVPHDFDLLHLSPAEQATLRDALEAFGEAVWKNKTDIRTWEDFDAMVEADLAAFDTYVAAIGKDYPSLIPMGRCRLAAELLAIRDAFMLSAQPDGNSRYAAFLKEAAAVKPESIHRAQLLAKILSELEGVAGSVQVSGTPNAAAMTAKFYTNVLEKMFKREQQVFASMEDLLKLRLRTTLALRRAIEKAARATPPEGTLAWFDVLWCSVLAQLKLSHAIPEKEPSPRHDSPKEKDEGTPQTSGEGNGSGSSAYWKEALHRTQLLVIDLPAHTDFAWPHGTTLQKEKLFNANHIPQMATAIAQHAKCDMTEKDKFVRPICMLLRHYVKAANEIALEHGPIADLATLRLLLEHLGGAMETVRKLHKAERNGGHLRRMDEIWASTGTIFNDHTTRWRDSILKDIGALTIAPENEVDPEVIDTASQQTPPQPFDFFLESKDAQGTDPMAMFRLSSDDAPPPLTLAASHDERPATGELGQHRVDEIAARLATNRAGILLEVKRNIRRLLNLATSLEKNTKLPPEELARAIVQIQAAATLGLDTRILSSDDDAGH